MDTQYIFHSILEAIGALVVFLMSMFVRGHAARITKIETNALSDAKDLSDFKLDAEKRFAKEETMQQSLARIHDRLDKLPADIVRLIHHGEH